MSGLKKKLIFSMIWKSQCTRYVERIWITFGGSLQHQQVGLILIMSGQKRKFSTLEPDFYTKRFEENIEGKDIETDEIVLLPLDNT